MDLHIDTSQMPLGANLTTVGKAFASFVSDDAEIKMKYRLVEKSSNQLKTTFHVLNSSGDVVGSINVPPNQVADLLKCWGGASAKQEQSRNPMIAAMLKLKPRAMSRAAILRGCL